jgi:hypothetical protein
MTRLIVCVISGFLHEVAENCALLGYHAAGSGNLLTFQDNLSVPSSGQGWDPKRLSRNVGKKVPLLTA